MFNIQYLFYSIERISFLNNLNIYFLKLFIISIIGLNIYFYIYSDRLFIQKDEELEKFILKRNPQMKKGKYEVFWNNKSLPKQSLLLLQKMCKKISTS